MPGNTVNCAARAARFCLCLVTFVIFLLPGRAAAQESESPPKAAETQNQQQTGQTNQKGKSQESDRVVGVVPAFNVVNDPNAPALTSSEKFHLFVRTVRDPYSLIMPAISGAILSGTGSSSGYGSGFSGFAKRYGASIGDSVSSNFFRLYAFPSLLHEDPRYFRAGTGSIGKRTLHSVTATVWGRKDDKTFGFNWSKLLGSAASAGLSNAYYPAENRGAKLTLERFGLMYASEIGYNALKEFWPDIRKKKKKPPTSSTKTSHVRPCEWNSDQGAKSICMPVKR